EPGEDLLRAEGPQPLHGSGRLRGEARQAGQREPRGHGAHGSVLPQAGEPARGGDTVVEVAELVDEADAGSVLPAPDPTAADLVHALVAEGAAVGHAVDETGVDLLHHLLRPRALLGGEGPVRAGEE